MQGAAAIYQLHSQTHIGLNLTKAGMPAAGFQLGLALFYLPDHHCAVRQRDSAFGMARTCLHLHGWVKMKPSLSTLVKALH